ncbi:MAG: DUF4129 domain-containing protein [Chloroflexi bacterium]|nr:DUF4129 domain-containing protein [Chloroflexota bacterium]
MSGGNSTREALAGSARPASQFAMEEIIRPLAIAGMMTCIAKSVAMFVSIMSPNWPADFIVILVFLVSLESIHAQRLLNRREAGQRDVFRFRFVEWVVILLVIRFGMYFTYGSQRLLQDMSDWGTDVATFFSAEFIMEALLIFVFWAVAAYLSKAIQELESSPFEKPPVVTDPDFYLRVTIPQHGQVDRRSRIHGITTTYFIGGALMIALAGLTQMDIRNMALVGKPATPAILNIMLYYAIGLLLISQVQYTTLKATWENQGISVAPALGQRWTIYVLLFLGLVGVISALLPVSYSVGVISVISTVVRWIAYVVLNLVYFIIAAVTYIVMFLGSLFKNQPMEASVTPVPVATPIPPDVVGGAAGTASWLQVARSMIFWGVLLAVATYAILRFLNDRWDLFRRLKDLRILKWLADLFRGLGKGSARLWRTLKSGLQRQVVALRQARRTRPRTRRVNWNRMTTRERVRFLYLALLEYAEDQGLTRPHSATPLEYEQSLAASLPESGQAAHQLTDSFMVARYSEHIVDDELVAVAQQNWRSARRALNERKRRLAQQKAEGDRG